MSPNQEPFRIKLEFIKIMKRIQTQMVCVRRGLLNRVAGRKRVVHVRHAGLLLRKHTDYMSIQIQVYDGIHSAPELLNRMLVVKEALYPPGILLCGGQADSIIKLFGAKMQIDSNCS